MAVRGPLRALTVATATLAFVAALWLVLTLPPRALDLDDTVSPLHVAGAYHVHTDRSDGTGSVDAVAAAAARAGLAFVVLTDHGDATRAPDPPAYRHDVLTIDAVEISTTEGHLVALGLDAPAPYPLGGHARDVLDDVHRLGGVGIVAHPDSPKPDLRWRGQRVAFDGIEWLNADSEWRDEHPLHLVASAARALFRRPETIASLFDRPVPTLERWDAAALSRPVFGLAATDAHARIGWREDEEPRRGTAMAQPSYETMFRTLTQTVVLDAPLTGNGAVDAAAILEALRRGRSFSTVRALAWPAAFTFVATGSDGRLMEMGERRPALAGGVTLSAATPTAPRARLTLLADGETTEAGQGRLEFTTADPGVYRVEASLPDTAVPWIVSNPIVLTGPTPDGPAGDASANTPPADAWIPLPAEATGWTVEHSQDSTGTIAVAGDELTFQFRLAAGEPAGQFAALAAPLEGEAGIGRLGFTVQADRPHRLSIQVRLAGPRGSRWRHSLYVDAQPRVVELRLQDFDPVDEATSRWPVAVPLSALLAVVDTVNAEPGRTGTIRFSDVRLGILAPSN